MTLDLSKVAGQVETMASGLKAAEQDLEARRQRARELLLSTDFDALKAKLARSKTTWLAPRLLSGLAQRHDAPACPQDFSVCAADGSHVEADRHRPVSCYLINIGGVVLRYGMDANASLTSRPALYTAKEDLEMADPAGGQSERVTGNLLGGKRSVQECQALADLLAAQPPEVPRLGLLDGSLIMWGLERYPDYVKFRLLREGLLLALDRVKSLPGQVAIASYISLPQSTEVTNALRVAVCPHDAPDCDRDCPRTSGRERECDLIAGVTDREVFSSLEPGQRSESFGSGSRVVAEFYREHEVRFFYLRLPDEIARVEYPAWVEERGLLGLLHTLVLDQCRRGQGYPVSLSESHEQAVVTAADREQFWMLVESALHGSHLPVFTSAKDWSKRTRWV